MGSQPCAGLPVSPAALRERRGVSDRRRRVFWSIAYGNFKPRRRNLPRRVLEYRFHHLDWHPAHLLFIAIVILLLSVGDAFLTLGLLSRGASEINPVMALVVRRDASVFTAIKMALTGASVVCMVFLARYRFMRRIRVELALYGVLLGYVWLIDYELRMVEALGAASIF